MSISLSGLKQITKMNFIPVCSPFNSASNRIFAIFLRRSTREKFQLEWSQLEVFFSCDFPHLIHGQFFSLWFSLIWQWNHTWFDWTRVARQDPMKENRLWHEINHWNNACSPLTTSRMNGTFHDDHLLLINTSKTLIFGMLILCFIVHQATDILSIDFTTNMFENEYSAIVYKKYSYPT